MIKCSFCQQEAVYDGLTKLGCWAHMCCICFKIFGIGVGKGVGQKLEVDNV